MQGIDLIVTVSFFLASLYFAVLMYFKLQLNKMRDEPLNLQQIGSVSVIVPIRNEENNILKILDSLAKQDFPADNFEVIFVNDHSTDESVSLLSRLSSKYKFKIHLLELKEDVGKRAGLKTGMDAAVNDLIVTTDADCIFHTAWLRNLSSFHLSSGAKMIIAPIAGVGMLSKFQYLQHLEMLGLMGVAAVSLKLGFPMLCSGANSAFDRRAYKELNPLSNTMASLGDDLALLNAFRKGFPGGVRCLFKPQTVVLTKTCSSFSAFILQRARWAKQTKFVSSGFSWSIGLLLGFNLLLPYFLIPFCFFFPWLSPMVIFCLLLKLFADYFFVKDLSNKLHMKGQFKYFGSAVWYNSINAMLIAFSWLVPNKWKGRTIK